MKPAKLVILEQANLSRSLGAVHNPNCLTELWPESVIPQPQRLQKVVSAYPEGLQLGVLLLQQRPRPLLHI